MRDEVGQEGPEGEAAATPPKLVSVDEFARLVTVSRATAWELIRDGLVESVKIGRLRRVPSVAIDAYVDTLRMQTRVVAPMSGVAVRLRAEKTGSRPRRDGMQGAAGDADAA